MIAITERPFSVGFLGAGYIADWHAAALRTVRGPFGCCLRPGRGSGSSICGTTQGIPCIQFIRCVTVGRAARCHPRITSPELHAQTAGQIIDAGLDVILEKPMAISVDECESLVERARSAGVKLGVGHNFLFASIYDRLKDDLAAGRLGLLDQIIVTWNKGLGQLQSGPFDLWMLREPGNIILEVGSHSVAHMLDLAGPVKILAVQASNPVDLPSGARFFRRWQVEADAESLA